MDRDADSWSDTQTRSVNSRRSTQEEQRLAMRTDRMRMSRNHP